MHGRADKAHQKHFHTTDGGVFGRDYTALDLPAMGGACSAWSPEAPPPGGRPSRSAVALALNQK